MIFRQHFLKRINPHTQRLYKSTVSASSTHVAESIHQQEQQDTAKKINESEKVAVSGRCPITGLKAPKKFEVPSLPYIGSMISPLSGISEFKPDKSYDFWTENKKKFGDFYSVGLPSIRTDIYGTLHILTDPREMHKILRKESSIPYGAIDIDWPIFYNLREKKAPLANFDQRDLNWQRQRRFLQTDLLSPQASKGYVKGMVEAAKIASKGAPIHSNNITEYMSYVTFDLFSTIMFGELTAVAGGDKSRIDPMNKEFCEKTASSLQEIVPLVMMPWHKFLVDTFGYKTDLLKKFDTEIDRAREIAIEKFRDFKERKEAGTLSENELNSYAARAIDRQAATENTPEGVSIGEVEDMVVIALEASIDTTSAVLNWIVTHLAMNPEVQEKVYQEARANLQNSTDDNITHEILSKNICPYLHAVLRENHRLTPALPINLQKDNAAGEVEIHGEKFNKGTMFALDSRSLGMDSEYLGGADPDTFLPERWLKDEVEKRKGTHAEVLDHPLLKEPFSAGARKCPGKRLYVYDKPFCIIL